MILVIDNYDSFTWNLVHGLAAAAPGAEVRVVRNDEVTPEAIAALDRGRAPRAVVISPGPCTPRESGVSTVVVERFMGLVPILGVCLGHQAIGAVCGMRVGRASRPVHGKTSTIEHDGLGVFQGVPNPTRVMRYHSLAVDPASVPAGWAVSAWATEPDGTRTVMGLRREWGPGERAPLEGVQFHPESYMSEHGQMMLANFLRLAGIAADAPEAGPAATSPLSPASRAR